MLNTAQRLMNYITQNEMAGRPKADLITPKQRRRIKKKMRRDEIHYEIVEEVLYTGPEKGPESLSEASEESLPTEDYSSMTVADLKAHAKSQGLKGYSAMKKAELVSLLQGE